MSNTETPELTVPVGENDHAQGSDGARVTLVEYGDYECPHCGRAHPIVKKVQEKWATNCVLSFAIFP